MVSVCQSVINLKMLAVGLFLSILAYVIVNFNVCQYLQKEALNYYAKNVGYVEMYRTKRSHSTKLKYVLLWTQKKHFLPFKTGQITFIENQCPHIDCYFTGDRKLFHGSLKKFDAIFFNGLHIMDSDLPMARYDHQKYIYVNLESSAYFPVCKSMYEDYFNWTYTYKLNSDILFTYFEIKNKNDEVVGPKPNMKWIETDFDNKSLNDLENIYKQKTDPVVWTVTNCYALNQREKLVKKIKKSLVNANLSLAVFGRCGEFSCPKEMASACWELFERKYFFFLSFENSNSEDYVTEKVVFPLHHYVIPIVYGGADYSRFLPPGSYLDATKLSPDELVAKMKKIMSSFAEFSKYFKWRNEYKYSFSWRNNICRLCSALHNSTMMGTRKSYKQFRKWWLPTFRKGCLRLITKRHKQDIWD